MRFLENGPILPDELLFAQDEGQVVFFCGAGVSKARVGLPSFEELADSVLSFLGSTHDSKERQLLVELQKLNSQEHTKGLISADHIFDSLTRSFVEHDINRAVAQTLIPPTNPDLSAHKIILKLAKLIGGQTRLITTNFDLLFESSNKKIKSSTRSNLPRIQYSDNDWGIVHLHGRVKSDYSGPGQDGFVLSSAEFGDAYLAQGWASDFVKDVLDHYMAVFIGYSADDPPIRYLLKGLQQSNSFQHKVYAFQVGPDDEAVAQWHEKGVEAIVYERGEDQNHDSLWNTLRAWGDRTINPTKWKKKVFSKARKGPSKLLPHERGMIAHLVKSESGARVLVNKTPPLSSEWLCVFDSSIRYEKLGIRKVFSNKNIIGFNQLYTLDDDPLPLGEKDESSSPNHLKSDAWDAFSINEDDRKRLTADNLSSIRGLSTSITPSLPLRLRFLANWISRVANQKITVWWAGQQEALHPHLLSNIRRTLLYDQDKLFNKVLKDAWESIFELNRFSIRDKNDQYELAKYLEILGWDQFSIREYARISSPFLKAVKSDHIYNNRSILLDNRRQIKSTDLVRIEVEYPEIIYNIEIPDEQVVSVLNILRINLENAVDLELESSYWLDFCAIEPDENNEGQEISRTYKLSGYVLHFVKLFRRLVEINPDEAKIEYNKWRTTDSIFIRLRVWASGIEEISNHEEFTTQIISLSRKDFWPFRGERDLMLVLGNRWKDLSKTNRQLIEKKILKGPEKLKSDTKEQYQQYSATLILNRLHWLKNQGCDLCLDLDKVTEKLTKESPEWKPEYAKKAADSHDGRGGFVKIDTGWSDLESLPISQILEKAKKLKRRSDEGLIEYEPFVGLCDELPLRALRALSWSLKQGQFPSNFWEAFLSRKSRKNDSLRLRVLTGGRITQLSDSDFSKILLTSSRWFETSGPDLREKSPIIYEKVWDKFINTIKLFPESSSSIFVRQGEEIDWVTEAINSPTGNLLQLHMTDSVTNGLKLGKGYPKKWILKVDQLLLLPNDARRFVMVLLARSLSWFFTIDPSWTEKELLHILESEDSDIHDKDAIWSGFLSGAKVPKIDLYIRLKPFLLQQAYKKSSKVSNQLQILSGIILAGWNLKDDKGNRLIDDEEIRDVLLNAGDDFRNNVLWQVEQWTRDENSDWSKELLEFLKNVWPKHKKIRTNNISASLCEIALNQKERFPDIAQQVTKLISNIGSEHVFIPELRKSESNIASKYPIDLLNLLYAMLPKNSILWPFGSWEAIKAIEEADPTLLRDPKLIELKSRMLGN